MGWLRHASYLPVYGLPNKALHGVEEFIVEGLSVVAPNGDYLLRDVSTSLSRKSGLVTVWGPNGSGKTTFLRLLAGEIPDGCTTEGSIFVRSPDSLIEVTSFYSPRIARMLGHVFVPQEPRLVPELTAAENIWFRRRKDMRDSETCAAEHLGTSAEAARKLFALWSFSDNRPVTTCSAAERQQVCLLRGIQQLRMPGMLLLDEVTTNLRPAEAAQLMEFVRAYVAAGGTAVYVSHREAEALQAQAALVFSDGRLSSESTPRSAISVTRPSRQAPSANPPRTTPTGGLSVTLYREHGANVDIHVGRSQSVGVHVDSADSGDRLFKFLAGLAPHGNLDGIIKLDAEVISTHTVKERRLCGLRFLPADRNGDGVFPAMSIAENLSANIASARWLVTLGDMQKHVQNGAAAIGAEVIDRLHEPIDVLSGGYKQRVLIERELDPGAKVLIARNPFQGIDVRASQHIAGRLAKWVGDGGIAVFIFEHPFDFEFTHVLPFNWKRMATS